ncbi:hypothetical protein ALC60_10872 [Trachymyrmex zeteki]|uniref:CCHC-type domain-containing protein n=1 Tax=Mycetomoellerius zeteki TaxID=64791 RepID=A0A151WQG8_9HYME|nr:hypothetical protein ALC60_10872 [Trachymyrmex zeteki]
MAKQNTSHPGPSALNSQDRCCHRKSFSLRYEIRPYIPLPWICYACHRVGHVSAACKSTPRCLHCGNDKHNEASVRQIQDEAPKCINCQGDHWTNDRTCPVITKQRAIVSMTVIENISIIDAKNRIENNPLTSSSFPSTNLSMNNSNFPTLPRSKEGMFVNTNRFDPLGAEEIENEFSTCAEAARSVLRSHVARSRDVIYKQSAGPCLP